jgi:uncharacterized protein (TIGR00266 family)
MEIRLKCTPSYTAAFCVLRQGEAVKVTRGSMVAMSSGVEVDTSLGGGGLGKAVLRSTLGGESFFMGRYHARVDQSWVAVAPSYPGDVEVLELDGQSGWLVERGGMLAGSDSLAIDIKPVGARMVLGQEGLVMLHVNGAGLLLVSSYGGLIPLDLGPDEEIVVDTGHIAALQDTMTWKLAVAGGVVTTTTTGEGLVMRLRGPGRVYVQSRSERGMRTMLFPDGWENSGKHA